MRVIIYVMCSRVTVNVVELVIKIRNSKYDFKEHEITPEA